MPPPLPLLLCPAMVETTHGDIHHFYTSWSRTKAATLSFVKVKLLPQQQHPQILMTADRQIEKKVYCFKMLAPLWCLIHRHACLCHSLSQSMKNLTGIQQDRSPVKALGDYNVQPSYCTAPLVPLHKSF